MPDPADWRPDLRVLVAREWPAEGTRALRDALASDAPDLVHARDTDPPYVARGVPDAPVCGACLLLYPFWRAGVVRTVHEAFFEMCRLTFPPGEYRGRYSALVDAWDFGPRSEVRAAVLAELESILRDDPAACRADV